VKGKLVPTTRVAAAVLAAALVAGACGSRRSLQEISAASLAVVAEGGGSAIAPSTATPHDADPGDESATIDGDASTSDGDASTSGSMEANVAAPVRTPDSPAASAQAIEETGEIVVATIGNYSGIPGAVFGEAGPALQAWTRWVNERGGIGGQRVRALVYDDAGDTSRHLTMVRQAVEQDGVVAFVGSYAPLTGHTSLDYLNDRRIPTVGGLTADPWMATSPMHYPQFAASRGYQMIQSAATVAAARADGVTRFGFIACVEATTCKESVPTWRAQVTSMGMEAVYEGQASLAQPDFTAECLAARDRDVEVFMISLDGAATRRLMASCRRQGYTPIPMVGQEAHERALSDDPNMDGLTGGLATYPFFLDGLAAGRGVREAALRYLGGVDNFAVVSGVFVSGLLLERALRDTTGAVTSPAIVDGLHTLRGDDLGGLTAPLTFRPNEGHQQPVCYFLLRLIDGRYTSPDGGQRHCI